MWRMIDVLKLAREDVCVIGLEAAVACFLELVENIENGPFAGAMLVTTARRTDILKDVPRVCNIFPAIILCRGEFHIIRITIRYLTLLVNPPRSICKPRLPCILAS